MQEFHCNMSYIAQLFEKNYKFIDKIKKKERKTLKKELQNPEIDDDERKRIRSLLQRMVSLTQLLRKSLWIFYSLIIILLHCRRIKELKKSG